MSDEGKCPAGGYHEWVQGVGSDGKAVPGKMVCRKCQPGQ